MVGTITHRWVTRGHCDCGYFWTTPGTMSIRCCCGQGWIDNNVLVSGDTVTDETAFVQAVAADLCIDPVNLIIEHVQ
jgi:hypothetical protein